MNGKEAQQIVHSRRFWLDYLCVGMGVSVLLYGVAWAMNSAPVSDLPPQIPFFILVGVVFSVLTGASFAILLIYSLLNPVRVFCPSCGKFIPHDKQWTCSRCDARNSSRPTAKYAFLDKCETCREYATGATCPGCEAVFPLGNDPADKFPMSLVSIAKAETPEQRKAKREERNNELRDEIQMNKLLAERARSITARRHAEQQSQPWVKNPRTPKEILEEHHAKQRDHDLALQESLASFRAQAEETYRNDPAGLSDYLHWLETVWKDQAIQILEAI